MYTDIIKILKFVLVVLKENDKIAFKGSGVYGIYKQFCSVGSAGEGFLDGRLTWELGDINTDTSFGSAEKKWCYFNNQYIRKYEEAKHILLMMFSALESENSNQKYANVFKNNFRSKSINGRLNEHSTVAHFDENLQLILYRFNFIENAKEVEPLRHFDTLFTKITLDLSTLEKRKNFIQETKPQINEIDDLLGEYENIMSQYYTISDLFYGKNVNV